MANRMRFSEEERTISGHSHHVMGQTSSSFPSTAGPVDAYLQEIRHEAHRALDVGRAEAVVAEVSAHIEDAVEAHVYDGISRPMAEKQVLAGFDDARRFVAKMADCAYETAWTRFARQVTFTLTASLMITIAMLPLLPLALEEPMVHWRTVVGIVIIMTMSLGSFLGRRIQWRRYLILGVFVALLSAGVGGYYEVNVRLESIKAIVPIQRRTLSDVRVVSRLRIAGALDDIALLESGIRAFSGDDLIPSNLMAPVHDPHSQSGPEGVPGYIVPRGSVAYSGQSPFKRSPYDPHATLASVKLEGERLASMHRSPYVAVPQRSWAKAAWAASAPEWLRLRRHDLQMYQQRLEACNILEKSPFLLNWHGAWAMMLHQGFYGYLFAALFVLHVVPAYLGRLAIHAFRQWVWRLRQTT